MIPAKQDWSQREGKKCSKVNDILQHVHLCENYENSSYLFLMYRQKFLRFLFIFFEIIENSKMFDRQFLVNVILKIRTKFHSNRFQDILHTVSKNLVSR